ncbi:MAG: DUF2167 domain-containing protein, partial [Pseudomonas sp.]|uniref:DUF2167 domain-containing protein n=1 Tax=Pseudomonas sp. TaxID=306 RepID=UPI003BB6D3ED
MLIKELMLAGLLAVSSTAALASVAPAPAAQEASDAQETAEYAEEAAAEVEAHEADKAAEELLASLHFQRGKIVLGDNLATLDLPEQFVYLNGADAELVLTKGWGNPPSEPSLGMILPAGVSPLADESWAVTVEYEENGYVEDGDAADIDYTEMLGDMQKDILDGNQQRVEEGYDKIQLIGWASQPHYDAAAKKLYWAKELKFGDADYNTLNYNIRVLGRKGVLVLNFIANMDQLPTIEKNLPSVLAMTEFNGGSRYADFDPDLDQVAAYGLGALVAGNVAAKFGFFAAALLLLKKFGVVLVAAAAGLFKVFS